MPVGGMFGGVAPARAQQRYLVAGLRARRPRAAMPLSPWTTKSMVRVLDSVSKSRTVKVRVTGGNRA